MTIPWLDGSWMDALAFAWMLVLWFVYGRFADKLPSDDVAPGNLNQMMHQLRRLWMRRMLDRPERILDSSLTGHSVASTTFFASTSMLVIAGLLGVLGRAGDAHAVIQSFGFAVVSSELMFELKVLGLIALFIVGFYKFTWALRQFNFACTLIGAAPCRRSRVLRAIASPTMRRASCPLPSPASTAGSAPIIFPWPGSAGSFIRWSLRPARVSSCWFF